MRILGVKRRKGKIPFVPTWRGWATLVLLLMVGGAMAFAEYSMQPEFCRSCHLMEPYYQAWHSSTHNNVSCVDCHFEPGAKNVLWGKWQASSQAAKFITQTYGSKPHAEVRDSSCMRSGCHERRLLEGRVEWEVPTARGSTIKIRFDHTPHLEGERRGKQLRCVSCHSQIVQGQHLVVTVDTCFLCHMKGYEHGRNEQTLGGCRSCHEAPREQIRLATGMFNHSEYLDRGVTCENCHADVVQGDGAVTRQVCWTCHNQEKQIHRFNETAFLHQEHVTDHKVECSSCHVQIEHRLNVTGGKPAAASDNKATHPMVEAGSCASCHVNMHGGPAELYRGAGARLVAEMPSPMHRAQVDCIACHKTQKQSADAAAVIGQTFRAAQEACTTCHAAKYDGVLEAWRKQIDTLLAQAQREYDRAETSLRAAGEGAPAESRRLLDDIAHDIRLVRLGHGVHNVNYATAILNAAMENSRGIVQRLGVQSHGKQSP